MALQTEDKMHPARDLGKSTKTGGLWLQAGTEKP